MSDDSFAEDTALLEKTEKTATEYLDLQRRAFTNNRTLRALEKEVDNLRQGHDAGDLDADGTKRYGIYLALLGLHADAIEVLEEHEGDEVASFFRGRMQREIGRSRQAVETLSAIAGKDPLFVPDLVEAMVAAGQLQEAAKACEKELKGVPDADAAYLRGLVADAEGDYAGAAALYDEALAANADHVKARFRQAFNHDLRGRDKEAREAYEMLREANPPHANALINLGVMYEDEGEYDKAVECYSRVLEVYPAHERARLFLQDARASTFEMVDEDRERRNDELAQKLRVPITDFELSVRSRNCLAKMEIKTLGDLVQKTESELLSYKNFGETSLAEIKEILSSKNLRLGMTVDGPDVSRLFSAAPAAEPTGADEASVEVLAKPIDFLELSVRSRKAMDRLGIGTVGELVSTAESTLLAQKNFGQTSMNEVKSKLAQYGLKLKD